MQADLSEQSEPSNPFTESIFMQTKTEVQSFVYGVPMTEEDYRLRADSIYVGLVPTESILAKAPEIANSSCVPIQVQS